MNPDDLCFTKTHEWIASDGTVGISDHAQHEITDVVFVELPKAGRSIASGEAAAAVESVKAAFDIYAPVAGQVTAVNEGVTKNPALVNRSPYDSGWLFKLQMSDPADRQKLMTHDEYEKFLKGAKSE